MFPRNEWSFTHGIEVRGCTEGRKLHEWVSPLRYEQCGCRVCIVHAKRQFLATAPVISTIDRSLYIDMLHSGGPGDGVATGYVMNRESIGSQNIRLLVFPIAASEQLLAECILSLPPDLLKIIVEYVQYSDHDIRCLREVPCDLDKMWLYERGSPTTFNYTLVPRKKLATNQRYLISVNHPVSMADQIKKAGGGGLWPGEILLPFLVAEQ